MIKQLERYGAVCAKARGLYAKRLTGEDWQHLRAMTELSQAAEYLSRTAGWGPLPDVCAGAEALRAALHARVKQEHEKLERFVQSEDDRHYMALLTCCKEHNLAMENRDYQKAWEYLMKDYHGLSALSLKKLLGTEADMLNVTYLLRLRRFPTLREKAQSHLVPIHLELTPALAREVLNAADERAALRALHGTHMAAAFERSAASPESRYREYMEEFCRKLLVGGDPSLAVPAAYLMLKELECQKLDRIVEALRMGRDDETGEKRLVIE